MDAGSTIAADQRRVDQHGGGEADAELLQVDQGEGGEDREHRDHHRGGRGDDAGRAADAVLDGGGVVRPLSQPSLIRLRMNTW